MHKNLESRGKEFVFARGIFVRKFMGIIIRNSYPAVIFVLKSSFPRKIFQFLSGRKKKSHASSCNNECLSGRGPSMERKSFSLALS